MASMSYTLISPRPVRLQSCHCTGVSWVSVWPFCHRVCHFLTSNCSITHSINRSYSEILTWQLLRDRSEPYPQKVHSVYVSPQRTQGRLKWVSCQFLGPALSTCTAVPGSSPVSQIHMKVSIMARYCPKVFPGLGNFSFLSRRSTLTGRRSCIQGQDSGWAHHEAGGKSRSICRNYPQWRHPGGSGIMSVRLLSKVVFHSFLFIASIWLFSSFFFFLFTQ